MITREGDRITVSGRLTLETARAAAGALFADKATVAAGDKLTVDLSQVEAVDSSAVSVLLQWLRQARELGVQLSYANSPANLRSLIGLYGVTDVLPLS